MKSRPAPTPINYRRPLPAGLASDPQVKAWISRLTLNGTDRPRDLSEEQLAWVYREVMRRRPEFSQLDGDLYLKAMAETCPILAAPELERSKIAEDMELMFLQPEMEAMWNSWDGRRGDSGPPPDFFGAKALMATMGMAGLSAHVDDNHAELVTNSALLEVFRRIEGRQGAELSSYKHLCKQLPRIANQSLMQATNVAMVRSLAELLPGRGIGERLLIDGTDIPAWCEQKGVGKTKQQEEHRRRNCPEAGARAVKRGSRGKRNVRSSDSAKSFMVGGDFWRGYYLVAIADQATGLPLVWIVQDASLDEAAAIVPLLSALYSLWPEIPAKVIAGDSAWDEKEWCRLSEQCYGIHPIFRWHDDRGEEIDVSSFSRKENVVARTNKGELICAEHRNVLDFKGAEAPARDDLRPGKAHPKRGEFRVRGTCKDGCGNLSMRMQADWRRLTYYPHFNHGGPAPDRHAYRLAMLTRLNGIEGLWERLEVGRNLGTQDGNRTRVKDLGSHETIISLALLSMTATVLADQRRQAGIPLQPQSPSGSTTVMPGGAAVGPNGDATDSDDGRLAANPESSEVAVAEGQLTSANSEDEVGAAGAEVDPANGVNGEDGAGCGQFGPTIDLSPAIESNRCRPGATASPFDELLDPEDAVLGV